MLISYHRIHIEVVCHRTTIVRFSYDIVRFNYDLVSHQAIIMKSYVIVRLSFDCRTMSYDLPTISQILLMRRKPIVSSVTTKLWLQYRNRVVVILKLQSGLCWIYAWRHNHAINEHAINRRAINRRAINDYMERLHPMMKYGNFYTRTVHNVMCS